MPSNSKVRLIPMESFYRDVDTSGTRLDSYNFDHPGIYISMCVCVCVYVHLRDIRRARIKFQALVYSLLILLVLSIYVAPEGLEIILAREATAFHTIAIAKAKHTKSTLRRGRDIKKQGRAKLYAATDFILHALWQRV